MDRCYGKILLGELLDRYFDPDLGLGRLAAIDVEHFCVRPLVPWSPGFEGYGFGDKGVVIVAPPEMPPPYDPAPRYEAAWYSFLRTAQSVTVSLLLLGIQGTSDSGTRVNAKSFCPATDDGNVEGKSGSISSCKGH